MINIVISSTIKLQNTKSYNEKAAWDIPWSLSRSLCNNVRKHYFFMVASLPGA